MSMLYTSPTETAVNAAGIFLPLVFTVFVSAYVIAFCVKRTKIDEGDIYKALSLTYSAGAGALVFAYTFSGFPILSGLVATTFVLFVTWFVYRADLVRTVLLGMATVVAVSVLFFLLREVFDVALHFLILGPYCAMNGLLC